MASIVDLENFAWWTEVRDTKSLEPLAFRQRWSDRQNSFTASLTLTASKFLTRNTARPITGNGGAYRTLAAITHLRRGVITTETILDLITIT